MSPAVSSRMRPKGIPGRCAGLVKCSAGPQSSSVSRRKALGSMITAGGTSLLLPSGASFSHSRINKADCEHLFCSSSFRGNSLRFGVVIVTDAGAFGQRVYSFEARMFEEMTSLARYKNEVLVVVNVASA